MRRLSNPMYIVIRRSQENPHPLPVRYAGSDLNLVHFLKFRNFSKQMQDDSILLNTFKKRCS